MYKYMSHQQKVEHSRYNSEYSVKALHEFLWCFIAFYHATLGKRTRPIYRVREGTAGNHFVSESFWHVRMIS